MAVADERSKLKANLTLFGADQVNSLVCASDRAYAILTILDSKASGLMTVNAFLGAFPALSIDHYQKAQDPNCIALWLSLVLIVSLVSSALLCFMVVRVQWRWLEFVDEGAGDKFCDKELEHLVDVIIVRTERYRWAWRVTFACLLGMIALAYLYATS